MLARWARTQRAGGMSAGARRVLESAAFGRRCAADALQRAVSDAMAVGTSIARSASATTAVTCPIRRARGIQRKVSRHRQHRHHRQQQRQAPWPDQAVSLGYAVATHSCAPSACAPSCAPSSCWPSSGARSALEGFHREWKLSLRGAWRRSNPLPDEPSYARQAGDCFGAARLAMTGCSGRFRTCGESALIRRWSIAIIA